MGLKDHHLASIIGGLLSLAACTLAIIALCTTGWRMEGSTGIGLFEKCSSSPTLCYPIDSGEIDAHHSTTRAFLIMGVILTMAAVTAIVATAFKTHPIKHQCVITCGLIFTASIFILIASAVYTAKWINRTKFEYSLWMSWASCIILMLSVPFPYFATPKY